MIEHVHETRDEPITGAGQDELVTDDGERCDCAATHPGISHKAYASQQLAEDLTIKPGKGYKAQGSSLGYRLTEPQHKNHTRTTQEPQQNHNKIA